MHSVDAGIQHLLLYEGGERMIAAVREHLLRLTAGAFFSSLLLAVLPKGSEKSGGARVQPCDAAVGPDAGRTAGL